MVISVCVCMRVDKAVIRALRREEKTTKGEEYEQNSKVG